MRGKAFRRYKSLLKKDKARKVILNERRYLKGEPLPQIKKLAAKRSKHLKACSCSMCGNPRKYWGEETIQERKQKDIEVTYEEINPQSETSDN